MRRRLSAALLAASLFALLASPASARAEHVSATAAVGGSLTKLKPTSAVVRITWTINCIGAAPGHANYQGNLTLLRVDTGDELYLGGVAGGSGQDELTVSRGEKDRVFTPVLSASCFEDVTAHGSGTVTASGAEIVVPAKQRSGGGGGGGNGDGGGDGGGAGGADDPLHPGGCANELRGTPTADRLDGGAGGDLVFALAGDDRVRGRSGHDCLIGAAGGDRLIGEDGYDRLTGGSGGDLLVGGAGTNGYDAGSGGDRVLARNDRRETIRCGSGDDFARVDRDDRVRGCERVARG